jgi:hypothetical protein
MARVDLSYNCNKYPWGSLDRGLEDMAKALGGTETDAGTGFGMRDIGYRFPNLRIAEEFVTLAKQRFPDLESNVRARN